MNITQSQNTGLAYTYKHYSNLRIHHCQAHLLADLLTIPLMFILILWNNFLKKKKKKSAKFQGTLFIYWSNLYSGLHYIYRCYIGNCWISETAPSPILSSGAKGPLS